MFPRKWTKRNCHIGGSVCEFVGLVVLVVGMMMTVVKSVMVKVVKSVMVKVVVIIVVMIIVLVMVLCDIGKHDGEGDGAWWWQ